MSGKCRSTRRHATFVAAGVCALALAVTPAVPRAHADDTPLPEHPGTTLDQVPPLLPGGLPPASFLPAGTLDAAVQRFRDRDHAGARRELEALLASDPERNTDWYRACFLYGYLCMLAEDWQLASLHFYRVRSSEHPLAVYAQYYEAYVDFRRGKYTAAIPECEQYIARFPNAPFTDDCRLLIADSHREAGNAATAIDRYKSYEATHPDANMGEQIKVYIARAHEVAGNHRIAARLYTNLAVAHRYATNGEAAEEGLARLAEAGVELPELTDQELWTRANTLKVYRMEDASAIFGQLWERYQDQPDSSMFALLQENEYAFRYETRQYGALAAESARLFDAKRGTAGAVEYLRRAIRNYNKNGDFDNAAKYAEIARTDYRGSFGGIDQDLAWYYTNATDYTNAQAAWARCLASKPSSSFYRWMSAYTTYRAGRWEEAIDALTSLVEAGGKQARGARFFRAKCHIQLDRLGSARADFDQIVADAPDSWYALVIDSRRRRARRALDDDLARVGRWPGPLTRVQPPVLAVPDGRDVGAVLAALHDGPFPALGDRSLATELDHAAPRVDVDGRPLLVATDEGDDGSADDGSADDGPVDRGTDWARLVWPLEAGEPAPPVPAIDAASPHVVYPLDPVGVGYSRDNALVTLARFSATHQDVWPLLPAIHELTVLGFREDPGEYIAEIYEEIKTVQKSRTARQRVQNYRDEMAALGREIGVPLPSNGNKRTALGRPLRDEERWARMLEMRTKGAAWRDLFILVEAPHHMTKTAYGARMVGKHRATDPESLAAWRQAYPLAFGEDVWELCETLDLDPMMIFGLMRIESVYHPTVVSRAGAVGVMQIMPGTGARVSMLSGYGNYSDEMLRDPEANVYFGIWYLSRLLARFNGQFPLAIGSYNGGPHNIGRWLRAKHGIGMEEFVEEVPFNETRAYIMRVVEAYGIYLAIYDQGTYVQIPRTTGPDDPTVINF